MSDDEDFIPHLGRQRSRGGGKRARRYVALVTAAAFRCGQKGTTRNRRFDGSRIGRGASIGRLLSSRVGLAEFRGRRVVVKTRLVRLGGKGQPAARAHLRYLQRDGVTREGEPGQLYSRTSDNADGKAFLGRCDGDRHQFRFIVSAEDGSEYPGLKPFIRRLMGKIEEDLGTGLDWVAVDHFNTAHPHSHIMLRGVDDQGRNLVIAREYIAHGIRERAAEVVTLDLGPRTAQEIEARLRQDIGAERLTAIDRRLLREMDADRVVHAADRDPFQQSLRAGRLQKLGSLGLAEHVGSGRWQLADGLGDTLQRMGERGDIIRTMQRALAQHSLSRSWLDLDPRSPGGPDAEPLVGRVVTRGLSDELYDRHYLIIDGVDGNAHYFDIGLGQHVEPLGEGSIVSIRRRQSGSREADRIIAEIAAANDGQYSIDLHLRQDPAASQAFAEAHVRRLEAIRRGTRNLERRADGTWVIGADYANQAAIYDARADRERPVEVHVLSTAPLRELIDADAATWLDRAIDAPTSIPVRDAGFGREVRQALAQRSQWLVEHGLAESDGRSVRLQPRALAQLERRELGAVAGRLELELGKHWCEHSPGERIDGKLVRQLDLMSGRFALIEEGREFSLVPWRDVLSKRVGQHVSGIIRADGISWRFGRGRSGPEIS